MNDLTGQMLGKYQVIERLGRGGMADVYRAYQPGLNRFVAIKVMHAHLSDESGFIERFKREAQSVAALRHPNIVNVIDFDAEHGEYYMVMEYIQGESLKARLKAGGAMPLEEVLPLIIKLADAVAYAHRQGMIHRDIKPANILFSNPETPILTDFGVAKIANLTQLTASGASVGTPAYMSPEASRSESVDERSDIYSLGIVMYEMLTGILPFDADTPFAIIYKQINEPPPSVRKFIDVPEPVERVLLKALAKNPADRYQSAGEFKDALLGTQSPGSNDIPTAALPKTKTVAKLSAMASDATVIGTDEAPAVGKKSNTTGLLVLAGVVITVIAIVIVILSSQNNPTPAAQSSIQSASGTQRAPNATATASPTITASPTETETPTATATPTRPAPKNGPTPIPTVNASDLLEYKFSEKYATTPGQDIRALLSKDQPFDALKLILDTIKADPKAQDMITLRDMLNNAILGGIWKNLNEGRPSQALDAVQKAVALYPDAFDWRVLEVVTLLSFRNKDDSAEVEKVNTALTKAATLIQEAPDRSEVYATLCWHYYNWPYSDGEKAMDYCTRAIERGSNQYRVYLIRGLVRRWSNGSADAILADFKQAQALAPDNPDVYGARADYYFDNGNYTAALVDYEQSYTLVPQMDKEARLAFVYLVLKQGDKAYTMYRKRIVDDRVSDAGYLAEGAFIAWSAGKTEDARTWYDLALLLDPKVQLALYVKALVAWDDKKLDVALAAFDQILQIDGTSYNRFANRLLNRQIFADRGRVLAAMGSLDDAVKAYADAINADGSWTTLYIEQAEIYIKLKNADDARSDLQRALDLNKNTKDEAERTKIIDLLRQVAEITPPPSDVPTQEPTEVPTLAATPAS